MPARRLLYRTLGWIDYDPSLSLREGRDQYFAHNGLGLGGYEDRWVVLRARGIPIGVFPNTAQRVRAVRLHDLHHVLTGYDTSWMGEAEIGAWELASGCADHWAAWILNSLAVVFGGWISPAAILRAYRRGRTSRNLYARNWDEGILEQRIDQVRASLTFGDSGARMRDTLFDPSCGP